MNIITLQGIIKNIKYSHNIGDIEYYKADLLVDRGNGKEDIIKLKFKRFSNPYKEGDFIKLKGNIRTFSQQKEDKNYVEVYVFTYMDKPETEDINLVDIDGRICKISPIRKTKDGKDVLDFIFANNIEGKGTSLNTYIPMVAWGKQAKILSKCPVGTELSIKGTLNSREYKKKINDSDFEIRVAHEVNVFYFEINKDK